LASSGRATTFAAVLKRVATTLAIAVAVVLSLLTFPSSIAWMIAAWLLWHSLLVLRDQAAWLPLVACLVILLVKRIDWPVGLVLLSVTMLVVALLDVRNAVKQNRPVKRQLVFSIGGLWIFWIVMAVEWHRGSRCNRPITLDPLRPVVCIGDSLTSGVSPYGGYPEHLQSRLSVPVINLGQAGITSEQALKQLPALVAAKPQIVVIELGGHDFLRGRSRASTADNLKRLIDACRQVGAEVVLMEIPRGFIVDPYAGLEREIARQNDLELVDDTSIRKLVLWSPSGPLGMWTSGPYLSDDGLHPNEHGNQYLAKCVAARLLRMYGVSVLAGGKSALVSPTHRGTSRRDRSFRNAWTDSAVLDYNRVQFELLRAIGQR
jgi:lysophospholipase L1-like esterase